MRPWIPLVLLLLAFRHQDPPKPTVDDAVKLVSAESMKTMLTYLASDELAGRHAGYAGNDKATEYIAAHFKKIGLAPVGDRNDKDEKSYFQSFEFGGKEKLKTRNCVGFVEGSDSTLKEEVVILGAHHDHVGQKGDETDAGRMRNPRADRDDTVWNGADDNGSGTTALLEVARAFMESRVRTKRSILFIAFGAEEYNLLGSTYYCKNPIFALAKTVAMINMDMVGRNPERKMAVTGMATSDDWKDLVDGAADGLKLKYRTSTDITQDSDHYPFIQRKVPAVHFFTGFHEDYHCQSDEVEKISFENMEKVGKLALRLVVALAGREKRIEWKPPPARARRLGVVGRDLSAGECEDLKLGKQEGGVELSGVDPGSVAEAGGLEEGDVLVEFNGVKLARDAPLDTLREEIKKAPFGQEVPIVVVRDGGRKTLKVCWEK